MGLAPTEPGSSSQRTDTFDPTKYPAKPAKFPDSWPREYPGHQSYWYRATLNDNLAPDTLGVLFIAEETYRAEKYNAAARRLGDFLIAAQLPEPQPAWAQQYDAVMQPIWARKFEPPAITASESQGVIRSLMQLYRRTREEKYLQPIPAALAWLKKSQLPDGRLARFYELKTNKPLYFTREYQLTYDDADVPTHYGFKVGSDVQQLEHEYEKLRATPKDKLFDVKPPRKARDLEGRVREVIAALDERGAWVTDGELKYHKVKGKVIDMSVAVKNLTLLAEYLAAK